MNYLLDTHTLIWWFSDSGRLSARVREILESNAVSPVVSVATLWEIQIKVSAGRLELDDPLSDMVSKLQSKNIPLLPITTPHVLQLQNLTEHHRDPFDRILIAQAIVEKMTLLSKDVIFAQYPVDLLW